MVSKRYDLDNIFTSLDELYNNIGAESRMKNLLHELGQLDWVSLRDLVSLAEKYNVDKRFVGPEIVTWSTGYKGHIVLFKAKSEGPENVFLKFQRIDLLPPEEILVSADENSRFLEALVDAGLWYFKAT